VKVQERIFRPAKGLAGKISLVAKECRREAMLSRSSLGLPIKALP
jgi:hypothetical protein